MTDLPEGKKVRQPGFCPNCDKPRGKDKGIFRCVCGGSVVNDHWYPPGTDIGALLRKIQGNRRQRRQNRRERKRTFTTNDLSGPPFRGGRKKRKRTR